ncbi:hypothetical protein [Enterobacter asburiae]
MKALYLNVVSIERTKENEELIKAWLNDYDNVSNLLTKCGIILEQSKSDFDAAEMYYIIRTGWIDFYYSSEPFVNEIQENILIDLTGMFDCRAAMTTIKEWGSYSKSCNTLCLHEDGEVCYSKSDFSSEVSFEWPKYIVSAFSKWVNLEALK